MSKLDEVKFGLIGFGKHASKVMLPAFTESTGAKLCQIASRSREVKDWHAYRYPDIIFPQSYSDVIDDPTLDAVYIALPNHLHAEWASRALQAGKHVLCEKPLAVTPDEGLELAILASTKGLILAEAFMYRHHPQSLAVKKMISEKQLGKIFLLQIHFHYHLTDPNNIRLQSLTKGGALFDVGCYGIDCARFLLAEEPLQVSGYSIKDPKLEIDIFSTFLLSFPSGSIAQITGGCHLPRENRYSIYGSAGKIDVQNAFRIPRTKEGRITVVDLDGKAQRTITVSPCNQYQVMIESFVECVRANTLAGSSFENGLQNARILNATYEALESSETIHCPPC